MGLTALSDEAVRNGASVAQKVQPLLIDDFDGREAEGRCSLGLDGTDRGQVPAELVVKFQAAPESRSGRLPVIGL
jgi:hypothetical protein